MLRLDKDYIKIRLKMQLCPKRNPCSLIDIISCRGCVIPETTGKLGNNISGIGIMSESETD
jgi:hypothetical protein